MLISGAGVERQPAEGLDLLTRACREDAKEACAQVGTAYSIGNGVAADPARAVLYLSQGCGEAPPAGCVQLAAHLEHGVGVQADPSRAAQMLDRACNAGDAEGCVRLARALLQGGLGLKQDEDRAARMIHGACAQGSLIGCTELASLEARGVGPISKDPSTAIARAEQACVQGYAEACTLAGNLRLPGARSEAEIAQVFGLFDRACQAGDTRGCTTAALELAIQKSPQAKARSIDLLNQSCAKLKSADVCGAYAAVLALGSAGQGRIAEGVRLAESLCAGGHAESCWVAASSRRAGTGVPRDREREAWLTILGCRWSDARACEAKRRLPDALVRRLEQEAQAVPPPDSGLVAGGSGSG
jgi:TPR repeat protein